MNLKNLEKNKKFLKVYKYLLKTAKFFAPLTSYKPKFQTMSNDIDFFKLIGTNGKIYGAIDVKNSRRKVLENQQNLQ